jgi:hypothetical protein
MRPRRKTYMDRHALAAAVIAVTGFWVLLGFTWWLAT